MHGAYPLPDVPRLTYSPSDSEMGEAQLCGFHETPACIWIQSNDDARSLLEAVRSRSPSPVSWSNARVEGLAIGLLQRRDSRRISNIYTIAQRLREAFPSASIDISYFEGTPLQEQARWMASHNIIIAAHGAALANAVFIRRETRVLELFPPNYYPYKLFGPLVESVGGVALKWHKGGMPVADDFDRRNPVGPSGPMTDDAGRWADSTRFSVPPSEIVDIVNKSIAGVFSLTTANTAVWEGLSLYHTVRASTERAVVVPVVSQSTVSPAMSLADLEHQQARMDHDYGSRRARHIPSFLSAPPLSLGARWGHHGAVGGGTDKHTHAEAIRFLTSVIAEYKVRTILDVGCGQMEWQPLVGGIENITFIGIDSVREVVEQARGRFAARHPKWSFYHIDITSPGVALPQVDLILARDVFLDLPVSAALSVVQNVNASRSRLLVTTSYGFNERGPSRGGRFVPPEKHHSNVNVPEGGMYSPFLASPPFNFPSPISVTLEGFASQCSSAGPSGLGLWTLPVIPRPLGARPGVYDVGGSTCTMGLPVCIWARKLRKKVYDGTFDLSGTRLPRWMRPPYFTHFA